LKHNAWGGHGWIGFDVSLKHCAYLAQTSDPYRAVLIENAINEYLKTDPGRLRLSLERLCDAIDREEAEKRRGEDWSIARDYARSWLRRLA
jgi:hypothetical protein